MRPEIFILIIAARRWWTLSAHTFVQFAGDGVSDVAELLLLLFEIFGRGFLRVGLEPVSGFFDSF